MPRWNELLAARLSRLRLSPAREREIIDELSQHLDDVYRDARMVGESDEAAIRRALEEIDERDLLTTEMRGLEQARAVRSPVPGGPPARWLSGIGVDLRYATRSLLHAKGWTAVILLLLAIGIGANTALFSASNALLFTSIPVGQPEALVRLVWVGTNHALTRRAEYGYIGATSGGARPGGTFSYGAFQELSQNASDMVDLFACAPSPEVTVIVGDTAELATNFLASGNYFRVLGVQARLGRVFTPEDDRPDAPAVAVISARFWQKHFGADPAAVGKVIRVNDVPITIIGVTGSEFTGVQQTLAEAPDISLPLSLDAQVKASTGRGENSLLSVPTAWWLQIMGRLRGGTTAASLEAKLGGVFQQTARAGLTTYLQSLTEQQRASSANRNRQEIPELLVQPGSRGFYDVWPETVATARVLNAVVVVILLIICANVANLMLSRGTSRRKEIAVRLSLGATRARLVRQLFTESLLLALAGGSLGLAVAYYGVQLLPEPASRANVFDGPTLAFAALAAFLTSLAFGALPAFRATDVGMGIGLKETSRSIAGRKSVLARSLLVVQVALSLVLLVAAGLFLQTLQELRRVDVGFNPDNLLLVRVTPRLGGYGMDQTTELYSRLLERVGTLPGVRAVALSELAPLSGYVNSTRIYVHGRTDAAAPPLDTDREIYRHNVSSRFFEVMGMRLLRGRGLTDRDHGSSPKVAVINETAAKKYFAGDPLGHRFGSAPDETAEIEVVGVVQDAKYVSVRDAAPPTMYVSYRQSPVPWATLEIRAADSPMALVPSIRQALREADPNLPIAEITTQTANVEGLFSRERLFAQAYALFGGIALLLASVGLFGLMSYNVNRRTSEMGIRMALGAQRLDVVRLVMRESLILVVAGLVVGTGIALACGQLVSAMLFGVPAHDLLTFSAAVTVMLVVSATAAYLPARRASRVDPIVALRYD